MGKFSNSEETYQGIENLIVKEQFINSCPQDLRIYLQERAPSTIIEELPKLSEKYLIAHKRTLAASMIESSSTNTLADFKYYKCNESGHQPFNCTKYRWKVPYASSSRDACSFSSWRTEKTCFKCGNQGHFQHECRSKINSEDNEIENEKMESD